jgi:hypothetical protein
VEALNAVYEETGIAEVAKHALMAAYATQAEHTAEAEHATVAAHVAEADHAAEADYANTATHAKAVQNVTEATAATEASIVESATSADSVTAAESAATAQRAEILEGIDGGIELTWSSSGFRSDYRLEEGIYLIYLIGVDVGIHSQPFVLYLPPSGFLDYGQFFYSTHIPVQYGSSKYYAQIEVSLEESYPGYRIIVRLYDVYNKDDATGNHMPGWETMEALNGKKAIAYYKKILD